MLSSTNASGSQKAGDITYTLAPGKSPLVIATTSGTAASLITLIDSEGGGAHTPRDV